MEKIVVGYLWLMSILGTALLSHEFGMIEGGELKKREIASHNQKLQNCIGVLRSGK